MKTSARSLIALTALLSIALTGPALAEVTRVSLEAKIVDVTPKVKKDSKDKDKKNDDGKKTETEVNKLVITVRNVSREAVSGVDVQYYIITRSSGDSPASTTIGKEGSKKIDLAPNSAAEVESESLSTTFTGAHTPKKEKRVRASGEKIAGWGVKAMIGDKLAGEIYSSDSVKLVINPPPEK